MIVTLVLVSLQVKKRIDIMDRIRVLVVEEDLDTGSEIQARLLNQGFDVPAVVDTDKEVIGQVAELNPQVVIINISHKGDMTRIETAEKIRQQFGIPVIYLIANPGGATIGKAVSIEPFGYPVIPLEERSLQDVIQFALNKHRLDSILKENIKSYREIVELAENPIFIINRDYSFSFINPSAIKLFNTLQNGQETRNLDTIPTTELNKRLKRLIETAFTSGRSIHKIISVDIPMTCLWLDTTLIPASSEEGIIHQVIVIFHDISRYICLQKEIENRSIKQIEQNMEQFQILNDRIRNPLATIIGIASMEDTEENRIIIEQAKKIDDVITQLDQGWIKSEAIRAFLVKHYRYGGDND